MWYQLGDVAFYTQVPVIGAQATSVWIDIPASIDFGSADRVSYREAKDRIEKIKIGDTMNLRKCGNIRKIGLFQISFAVYKAVREES